MSFGLIALVLAGAGAAWLLIRLAQSGGLSAETRNVTILKVIVLLGLVAVLGVARLWPLAFMVLIAAGGVMAIETWRAKAIADEGAVDPNAAKISPRAMTLVEAAAFLGVTPDADIDEIKAAHRKLISQIHPDKGGTDFLAAKINEARDLMLAQRSSA